MMKKISEKRNTFLEVTIHIATWGIIFGFPIFFLQRENGGILWQHYISHLGVPLTFLLTFYINYLFLIPQFLFKNNKRRFYFYNVLLIITAWLLLNFWNNFFFSWVIMRSNQYQPPRWIFVTRDIVSLVFVVGLSAAIRMSSRWAQAESARQEAEKSRAEAELKNLRNQINPHFLLNTLNNIYALIAFDTNKAQEAVQELSKLLRYILYDNQQNFVPLSKEVDFIRNYIELMRIRLSSSVKITTLLNIYPDSQTPVAPLLFISLIENAFKHGISPTDESYVYISISEKKDEIICEIKNSNYPKTYTDKSGSGIGLMQVQKRLEILYKDSYIWDKGITKDGKEYYSILRIKDKTST